MTPRKSIKLALVQHACTADSANNLAQIQNGIEQAAAQHADLVLLQELHNTPYFCIDETTEAFNLAETIPGPTTAFLSDLARQHKLIIVGSLFEKRAAGLYHNTAVVFENDGTIAGKYRKMHIPDDPGFYEKFYFTPGDLGFNPIQTSIGKLGVLVCWDQWFPEAARLMALAGADILLYPTAIGWDPADDEAEQQRQLNAWITIQRSHAVANGIPVAACNRIGIENSNQSDSSIIFWGNSFACGPQGEILLQTAQENSVVTIDIDLQRSEDVRRIWPYLRDRRIDDYGKLTRRYIDTDN